MCYYNVEGVPVKTVHMINSNHFDAGYAGLTVDVVNTYFRFSPGQRPSERNFGKVHMVLYDG